jgi:putative spermidine/putrescine transport system ATP-binding protein
MAGAGLDVENVEVAYGEVRVLKGISLAIAPGEFVALLGSSGCGKTTLLRAISGFVPVNAGAIRCDGRDITNAPPDKRDMAMVFQSYALWPHMNAAKNIAYGLRLRGWSRADIAKRVEEMLTMLKLGGLGERMVGQLSGGQRQRVALGRALAISPRILLLDEPLSNLDARIREDVRHEIKALQESLDITAIHVTHDREEAMVMADRIVILDAGAIAQVGTPEDVYNRPNSPFVAAFMGAGNTVALRARTEGEAMIIEAGPHNSETRLTPTTLGRDGMPPNGKVVAYFRSEAARLASPGAPTVADALHLRGRIAQSSYPGGFWRYAVRVGEHQFLVDDDERYPIGTEINIRLSPSALHIYAATS